MNTLHRGVLYSFDAATWTAVVQLDGSTAEQVLPVGEWIPSGMLAQDDVVAVLIFDDTDADAGIILGPYGGVGGWSYPALAGLTTGQPLRATSATGAAFGALDLANANAVTGILPVSALGTNQNPTFNALTLSSTLAVAGATTHGTADSTNGVTTINIHDSGTTTYLDALILNRYTSGTPAANLGGLIKTQLESTTALRIALQIGWRWVTATDASRKAQAVFYIEDTGTREAFRIEASGSAPMIGFLGANAVVRQTVAAAAPAGGTGTTAGAYDTAANRNAMITLLNSIRTAGINLGLWA